MTFETSAIGTTAFLPGLPAGFLPGTVESLGLGAGTEALDAPVAGRKNSAVYMMGERDNEVIDLKQIGDAIAA